MTAKNIVTREDKTQVGKPAKPAKVAEPEVDTVEASRAPLMDHLVEARDRLIWSLIAVVVFGVLAFAFADQILKLMLYPFDLAAAKAGAKTESFYTAPLEMLMLKLKLAMLLGLVGGFPVIAWQVWRFVAPGLYKNERGAVAPFLMAIPVLFVAGGAVVYYVLLPLVMDFAFSQQTEDITYLPRVTDYYSLAISLFGAFGAAFQLPVILALLAKAGIVSSTGLAKTRKFAIVGIFAIAMVMTPPDVFSQTVLAVPVYLLYEASIVSAWMIERGRKRREAAEAKAEEEAARRRAAAQSGAPSGSVPAGE
jgi:sec-independent protein translocase protein TatC